MKYNATSIPPQAWRSPKLEEMKKRIEAHIFKKKDLLPSLDYGYEKLNLLKNGGVMFDDQVPHYDYKPL